jgi:hypothetical protein
LIEGDQIALRVAIPLVVLLLEGHACGSTVIQSSCCACFAAFKSQVPNVLLMLRKLVFIEMCGLKDYFGQWYRWVNRLWLLWLYSPASTQIQQPAQTKAAQDCQHLTSTVDAGHNVSIFAAARSM